MIERIGDGSEKGLHEFPQRIASPRGYIAPLPRQAFDVAAGRAVTPGGDDLLHVALPYFYFHMTTAYAILHHDGVSIGKRD